MLSRFSFSPSMSPSPKARTWISHAIWRRALPWSDPYVYRHEPLSGAAGRGKGLRECLAFARHLSRRRAGLRRVPPVAGAKRRRPHALFVAYLLALARGLRRLDPFRCLPSGPSQCGRVEEHTSELQSLMRNSYSSFLLKQTKHIHIVHITTL